MYYQLYNIHNTPIGKIIANNDNDARMIATSLYPTHAAIHEISHAKFHAKPPLLKRLSQSFTITPTAQAVLLILATIIAFAYGT